ncbi:MAG: hypothetical protein ABFS02_02645, partial [Pseudomonadota bacterium]
SALWLSMTPFAPKRNDFADDQKATLKQRARELSQSIEWWYRDRYRLTAHDPVFLAASHDDMLLDFHAADYVMRWSQGKPTEEYDDDSFDLDAILNDPDQWEELEDDG